MARRKRKKREFSKVLITWIGVVNTALILYSCVLCWYVRDTTLMAVVIGATMAEFSIAIARYYDKAKAENEIKLQKLYEKESANDRSDTHL